MSIFSPDLSIQITGDSTLSKTYNTKDNPNLTFHSRAGIYNSADNTIKIFTNNVDALTIDANQKVICNGSLITNITWNNIDGKPTNFPTNWDNVSAKPSIFPTNWDNVSAKPSIFPTNWDNVSAKPSIFPTNWDNVASKPTNFQADWLTTVTNRPEFAAVATTGNWNDLLFVPDLFDGTWTSLSGKPTNFQADWNTTVLNRPTLFDGTWTSLSGKPTNFQADWNTTVLNRPTLFDGTWTSLSGKPTNFQADWLTTVTNKPTLFDGTWTSLSGKPNNFQADWLTTVTNKPTLFDGTWTSLSGKPTNFQADWNTTVTNIPNALTNISNIFVTSNVLSNTSNNLFQSITSPNLTNYFSKTETSNIFTTSNHIQNSLNFINYNNLNNKPWFSSGTNIYNSNIENVGIGTINPLYKLDVNGEIYSRSNIIIDGNVGIGTFNPISKLTINGKNTDYSILNINPVAWYKFDNPSNLGFDSSGNNYHLTNQGSPTYNANNYLKGNGAVNFNGSSWLTTSSFFNLNARSYSISLWAFSTVTTIGGVFRMFCSFGGNSISANNFLMFGLWGGQITLTNGTDYAGYGIPLEYQNKWTHVVGTYNSTTKRFSVYVNSVLASTNVGSSSSDLNAPNQIFQIGRRNLLNNYQYWFGDMDDFRVYDIELSATQVLELYKNSSVLIRFTNTDIGSTINDGSIIGIDLNNDFIFENKESGRHLIFDTEAVERMRIVNNGNVGIGTTNPFCKLDINGEFYLTSNLNIGNIPLKFINSFSNATLTSVAGTNESYLQYTGNGTLNLNEFTSADLLIVGAGGNGGFSSNSGGGGAGEVIFFPNFSLRAGNLDITIGNSSTTFANRTSKISVSGNEIIRALGGGDGGFFQTFTSNASITLTKNGYALYNYTNTTNMNAGSYTISFSTGAITITGLTIDKSYPLLKDGSGNTINPVAWYKFDNPSNLGFDSSGNNYHLTNQGSPTYNASNLIKGNGAVNFNGSSWLTTSSFFNLNARSYSISFWAFSSVNTTGGTYRMFCSFGGDSGSANNFLMFGIWDGFLAFTHWTDYTGFTTSKNYINIWTHFVGTYNSTTKRFTLYRDGSQFSTNIGSASSDLNAPNQIFQIGRRNLLNNYQYWFGDIDDFRVYDFELSATQVSELYFGRVSIYTNPTTGGSGGGGALNQLYALNGAKFDEYKSYSSAGFSGSSSSGGNGGSALTTARYTTTITGSSLSVGLGGVGIGSTTSSINGTNYGDGGSGNGGVGANGIIIIRFKEPQYLQIRGIKDNANSGLILNANETTNKYQLRLYPWSDTYQLTGIPTRGYSFRTNDGTNSYDLLNLFSSFGGRIGVKTKNPLAVFDVNGDINCKTLFVNADEQYGVSCQITNQNAIGEASITLIGGQATSYGNCAILYSPATNLGIITSSKSLQIKTARSGSYIYIDDNTGNVGIGLTNPSSKLELVGDINSTSMTCSTGNMNSISTYGIALNNGNITGVNKITSVELETGPIKCGAINLQGSGITNGGTIQGTCTQARFLLANVNEWHYSQDNRNRFYFTDDGNSSHTVIRTGSTTVYFQDKDGTDYALLDRFGISSYFEVVTTSGYDSVGVLDASSTGVYIYRKMLVRLNSFTEIHRVFVEDELFINYDDFINEFVGRVVVSTGKIKQARKEADKEWLLLEGKEAIMIDDAQCVVQLSRKKKDKSVYGVITKRENKDFPNRICVNGLGEGGIWVVNTTQNLENGDYLQTSDELGYAEKQCDDILHNYTIAKVVMDCTFELDNPNYKCEVIDAERNLRRAFLACVYYCG